MSKILHIIASPRKARSHSKAIAEHFLKQLKNEQITELDLWSLKLPEFDETSTNARFKLAAGQGLYEDEGRAVLAIREIFEKFNDADKYVFSVPMWNFGIPYKLKHFLDVIIQPGMSFTFSPDKGFSGLLGSKKALIVASRGGEYSGMPGDPMDFQVKYLKTALNFIGISDIKSILVEGMNMPAREASIKKAALEAEEIAKIF